MHSLEFDILTTINLVAFELQGVMALRYWCGSVLLSSERSFGANASLTTSYGHSCRHLTKGHPGVTTHPPAKSITDCSAKKTDMWCCPFFLYKSDFVPFTHFDILFKTLKYLTLCCKYALCDSYRDLNKLSVCFNVYFLIKKIYFINILIWLLSFYFEGQVLLSFFVWVRLLT